VQRDEEGNISGIEVQQISSLLDENGGFSPKFVEGTKYVIPCDTIALAIGQGMDESFLNGWDKKNELKIERGVIVAERGTGRTSVPGIYTGGDCGFGAALFITAIRHGQETARAIDHDLLNTNPYKEFVGEFTELPPMRDKEYLHTDWALPTLQPADQRIKNLNLVENNYTPEEVHQQANRCLQCHVSPVFDGALCIKCNGCVDVCPCNCLTLVPLQELNLDLSEGNVRKAVDNYYGIDSATMSETDLDSVGSVMLKNEDVCIRCGLCAEKCPTQAVTMDAMNYSFRWIG
jgi:ferredoxin